MQYFDFAPTTIDRKDSVEYKAISFIQSFASLSILSETIVEAEEQFRADKISYRLYGTPELDWVLNATNGFEHGFKEYIIGRKIKHPKEEDLTKILNL